MVDEGTCTEIHAWELTRWGRNLQDILANLDYFAGKGV